jgi:hypothetical protein
MPWCGRSNATPARADLAVSFGYTPYLPASPPLDFCAG